MSLWVFFVFFCSVDWKQSCRTSRWLNKTTHAGFFPPTEPWRQGPLFRKTKPESTLFWMCTNWVRQASAACQSQNSCFFSGPVRFPWLLAALYHDSCHLIVSLASYFLGSFSRVRKQIYQCFQLLGFFIYCVKFCKHEECYISQFSDVLLQGMENYISVCVNFNSCTRSKNAEKKEMTTSLVISLPGSLTLLHIIKSWLCGQMSF